MTPRNEQRRGFTLIELVVVIGIVALLLGLAMPTLSQARARGRATQCLSHQHQLAVAMSAWTVEHGGRYPQATLPLGLIARSVPAGSLGPSWTIDMQSTVDVKAVAVCPSDASPHFQTPDPLSLRLRSVSYGSNSHLTAGPDAATVDHVQLPSATILLGELVESGSRYVVSDRLIEPLWDPHAADEYAVQVAKPRHQGVEVWAFVDGHVASHRRAEVHAWEQAAGGEVRWLVNRFRPEIAR